MEEDRFLHKVEAYGRWKTELEQAILDYVQWLDSQKMSTPEIDLRIYETREALRSDRLTVAFVAEFSRGKTELINAIFFANYGCRLLPSEAGRTTMCPTELFYDSEADQAYLRLLPIETRLQDTSIAEFKRDPDKWSIYYLNVDSPEEMSETFKEVSKTKMVAVQEAEELGLYNEDIQTLKKGEAPPSEVEVPVWRHALISFPHPLLKQGLAILDTPGLNALGTEPELTLNMLPNAQSVLFVLAADTGVTRSDLEMWQHHIASVCNSQQAVVVALNKIDTLWDEIKGSEAVANTIEDQRQHTADMLAINPAKVFPISAQKALLGKIRHDHELQKRSAILELEEYLADKILPVKQEIVKENVANQIGALVENSRDTITSQLKTKQQQLEELRSLSGKNSQVIQHLMKKTREKQVAYHKQMENFQSRSRQLTSQGKGLLDTLSIEAFDNLISVTRKDMAESWTTAGMKKNMKILFDGLRETMQQATINSEQTLKLVNDIYQKFHSEFGLPKLNPKTFPMNKYSIKLARLYQHAEAFRTSSSTVVTEQRFVIKKFFISLVGKAREIFFASNKEASLWLKEVMNQLIQQIKANKQLLDQQLETLRKIHESRESLDSKIKDLETACRHLDEQLANLEKIYDTLSDNGHPAKTVAKKTSAAAV